MQTEKTRLDQRQVRVAAAAGEPDDDGDKEKETEQERLELEVNELSSQLKKVEKRKPRQERRNSEIRRSGTVNV